METALEYLVIQAKKELQAQGHKNTGKLERSFETRIKGLLNATITGEILQEDYGIILDRGVDSTKVPYSRGRGGGGKSKYIEGLIKFLQSKGKSIKEAKSIAFATANKAAGNPKGSGTGHPTRPYYGGKSYTSNGKRIGWIAEAYSQGNINQFERLLRFDDFVNQLIIRMITNLNKAA